MASRPIYSGDGSFVGLEEIPDNPTWQQRVDLGLPRAFDSFMTLSPEQRRAYLLEGGLDGLLSDPWNSMSALQPQHIQQAFSGTGIDAGTQQQLVAQFSDIQRRNQEARTNDDFIHQMGVAGPLLVGAGGMLAGGLLGGAASGTAAGGISSADAALAMGGGLEGAAGSSLWGGAGGYSALGGLTAADLGLEVLPFTTDPSLAALEMGGEGLGLTGGGFLDGLASAGGTAVNALKGLGGALGGLGGLMPGGGWDTAAALAPALAAISYAKNTGPFDTSRLTDTYNQFQPSALAYEYDQNTARGRDQLTSSLGRRGVMGSSFGNMDLTNFQTSRDLGRQSLINQGFAQRAGIANSILDAEVKDRALKNQLYGSALYSIGNIFGGKK